MNKGLITKGSGKVYGVDFDSYKLIVAAWIRLAGSDNPISLSCVFVYNPPPLSL